MSFLRHRQRSISAVTRGRWIVPSRRTWDVGDAPRVAVSETGLMTVTCRTSPAPLVVVSSTGVATWNLGDVTSPATPVMMMRESGAADDAWAVVESGVQLVSATEYEFVAVAPSSVASATWVPQFVDGALIMSISDAGLVAVACVAPSAPAVTTSNDGLVTVIYVIPSAPFVSISDDTVTVSCQ